MSANEVRKDKGPWKREPLRITDESSSTGDEPYHKLGGVCTGFAYTFGLPPWIVQLIWILFAVSTAGVGSVAYILFWILMPVRKEIPDDFEDVTNWSLFL